jgi:hypothetical protein
MRSLGIFSLQGGEVQPDNVLVILRHNSPLPLIEVARGELQ